MTALEREYAVQIPGLPKPKGSMKCIGARGNVKHQLIEQVDNDDWRARVHAGGLAIPAKGITSPVGISVTFTLPRPASHYGTGRNATVLRADAPAWPTAHGTGDWDKLARIIGDSWQTTRDGAGAGVIVDDSQVCHGEVWKCFVDTPGCPDVMDRPGAVIRIFPI